MTNSPETSIAALSKRIVYLFAFPAFLISAVAVAGVLFFGGNSAALPPLLVLLLLSALLATLLSLSRSLAVQNVLAAAGIVAVLSGLIEGVALHAGFSFGQGYWLYHLGPRLFHLVAWPVPLIWVVNVFNSRGVARLLLRPFQQHAYYGFLSLGATVVLIVIFNLSLGHFAAAFPHWPWPNSKSNSWFGFLSQATLSGLILAVVTPWLINKKPGPPQPPDYHPLLIWLLLVGLMVAPVPAAGSVSILSRAFLPFPPPAVHGS